MTELADLLAVAIKRKGSIRAIAKRARVSKTVLLAALSGGHGFGREALERLAAALDLDPIEVLATSGRLPREVVEYLCAHPDLVKRLAVHADEERRARGAEAGASAVGQEA